MLLTSDPISLCPAGPALAEELADFYRRNREFLQEFEPRREEEFFTPARQKQLLEQAAEDRRQRTAFRFCIRHRDRPGEIVGEIGLNSVVWGAFRSCFLGYKLDKELNDQGCMTTAVGLIADYAFRELRLHRIEANVMPRNKRSLRVLEKNGFSFEGLAKYYLNINGVWEDHVHMVLLNEEMHT